ncbi:MAG TPA: MauE/DoxX family redox-associated membrane protein [Opitutaceae bacterium]|nr:MauE/DoxX family redox-associated membrane protein [Opitutaceae bacterium]
MIRLLDLLARVILAALFLYAGIMKLRDPAGFAEELENYRLISGRVATSAGYLVPWLEILAAAALLTKPLRLGGWLASVALSAGFTAFVVSAWMRGLDISCGCFGSSDSTVGLTAAARAAGIFIVAAAGLRGEIGRQANRSQS